MINKNFTSQNRKIRRVENSNSLLQKKRVDINILLNRVRIDKKREKLESTIFISLISLAVIISGIVISFR